MIRRTIFVATGAATLGAAVVLTAVPADASSGTLYVSPHGSSHASGRSCDHAGFTSIQKAIDSSARGGTVVVCRGTYKGSVMVDRRVTLSGRPGATIDATGMAYGVGVTVPYVTIRGLTVKNASDITNGPADGIITGGFGPSGPIAADHVSIVDNRVVGNLGSGIDLNSTSYSVAIGNTAVRNGVGVNVADDLGPRAAHNVISRNVTNENFGGCGIALADHTGAGIVDNLIVGNVANDNGLSTPTAPDASAGSGVILASPVPGGIVTGNTIALNTFNGNGHGGVVVHAHAPGSDFSGNAVVANRIGTNNLRTDTGDLHTTGIYLGSATPLRITVSANIIGPDHYGLFTAGDVTLTGGHNIYRHVAQRLGHIDTY